jgi:hypothetical protein
MFFVTSNIEDRVSEKLKDQKVEEYTDQDYAVLYVGTRWEKVEYSPVDRKQNYEENKK